MAGEKDEKVFEEATAERELEELRLAIEESRRRRRRADEAFDAFLKTFGESPRRQPPAPAPAPPPVPVMVAAPPPVPPPPVVARSEPLPPPLPPVATPEPPPLAPLVARAPEPLPSPSPPAEPRSTEDDALDEGLMAFAPAPSATSPVEQPQRRRDLIDLSSLDHFANEAAPLPGSGMTPVAPAASLPVPAALSAPRRPGVPRAPIVAVAVVAIVLVSLLLWRGRSSQGDEEAADTAAPAASAPAAPAAAPAPAPQPPPAVEVATIRRVWLRVIADGAKVVEREVPADTKIPLEAASQVIIRAGDAGAVRVSVGGKDQGVLGVTGQPATRTYALK